MKVHLSSVACAILGLLAQFAGAVDAPVRTDQPTAAIVTSSSVDAFTETINGIRKGFEVGVQAGEMARSFLGGTTLSQESPRKVRLAANLQVARLWGLRSVPDRELPSGIAVIQ